MKKIISYSVKQVKEKMDQYLEASEQRLRSRLRQVWKKQTKLEPEIYDKVKN